MQKKIFMVFSIVSFLLILTLSSLILLVTYSDVLKIVRDDLGMKIEYFSIGYEELGIEYLESVKDVSEIRITLISQKGEVLFENYADPKELENHSNRSEIKEARATGYGESRRTSNTLNELTYYYAKLLDNGEVLRTAITFKSLAGMFKTTINFIIVIIFLNLFVSIYISRKITKILIKPINQIDLENPLDNDIYNELSPLLTKMHRQKHMIDEQIEMIKMKNREFKFITETMSDALIVFGSDKHILSANRFSLELFNNNEFNGKSYLEFCRNVDYIEVLEKAFSGQSAETKYKFNDKYYLLTATPVLTKGTFAVVLFACDITQQEQSEQMRRDFSANVSHELKTPLTSIIGFSDIMLNGIAKKEDFSHFIEKINLEANRLLMLIEDIIRLSNLDEDNIKREFAPIKILETINSVVEQLEFKANNKGVKFHVSSEDIVINGVAHSLYELVFNLCDNAISYNKDNGDIFVNYFNKNDKTILSIKDTGIGIPANEISHIFERFYRIDKSHSKDTGGTGLGLSIVKHIAMLHEAKIEINSELGQGTEIQVIFNNIEKI